MELETKFLPIELANGVVIRVEATQIGESTNREQPLIGEEIESDVSLNIQPLKEVTDAIEGIAGTIKASFDKVKPTKASVEFGVDFAYESGQLTAMIVKGSGKVNLKITLEWSY